MGQFDHTEFKEMLREIILAVGNSELEEKYLIPEFTGTSSAMETIIDNFIWEVKADVVDDIKRMERY